MQAYVIVPETVLTLVKHLIWWKIKGKAVYDSILFGKIVANMAAVRLSRSNLIYIFRNNSCIIIFNREKFKPKFSWIRQHHEQFGYYIILL